MANQRNPWPALFVYCLGSFAIMLDSTIVGVAIPTMIDSLQATLSQVLRVVNAYLIAFAVLLITAGRLGDAFGQRNLFTVGLAIFTAASAACGLAPNVDVLIGARVLQGLGRCSRRRDWPSSWPAFRPAAVARPWASGRG